MQHILDQCRSWVGDLCAQIRKHLYLAFRYVLQYRSVREPVEAAAICHWPRVRGEPTGLALEQKKRLSLCPSVFSGVSEDNTSTSLQRGYAYLDDGRHLLINIHHQT